jgi:predicted O-methyltransferase YrrM
MNNYDFTKYWFHDIEPHFKSIVEMVLPGKILEIGSFEGLSTISIISYLTSFQPIEMHCVDSWGGSLEHLAGGHEAANMSEVEARFRKNVQIAISNSTFPVNLTIHKINSDIALSRMISNGMNNSFDMIYIDGSHQASDVLCDAVLSFRLLKIGGVMIFDDYLWAEPLVDGVDILRCPKIAIDAFTNIYRRKIRIIGAPIHQIYLEKLSD